MSVHYKFKNTINYDAVKFDGVYISANDLKSMIVQQKKLGHSELQVVNEDTGQVYADDQQIPKNTNVIVSRLPAATSTKKSRLAANQPYPTRFSGNANGGVNQTPNSHLRHHHNNRHHSSNYTHHSSSNGGTSNGGGPSGSNTSSSTSRDNLNGTSNPNREAMELVSTKNMSEEEKIKYIQSQSTKDFDTTRYPRGGRGGGMGAGGGYRPYHHRAPGPGYVCRKCNIPGHLVHDCKSSNLHKVKRSSGIPRAFLKKVDSKEKGALMTPTGEYAVPYIDLEAYNNPKVEKAPFFEDGVPGDAQ